MKYFFRSFSFLLCGVSIVAFSQQRYPDYASQITRLQSLSRKHSQVANLKELATTKGNQKVYVLTLSSGDDTSKPGIVVVGGVSGSHLTGSELAIRFAEKFLDNDSLKSTLAEVTYYIFPNMSPDAMSQYFATPSWPRTGNASETDDDRDGRLNEDGYDDLNGDGKITWMRVKDITGDWIVSTEDERVMRKVDPSKGELGIYKVYMEGIDNDGDGQFNEDGPGGVAFDKNFTYQYPWFQAGAGEYQVSEVENRAMLDFLYEKRNVFLVMSFGPGNNLTSPFSHNPQLAARRVVASVLKNDAELNKRVSETYKKFTSAPERPLSASGGDFLQWAYFHYGRQSYSTPGFFVPDMKRKGEKAIDESLRDIRWADSISAEAFTPWRSVQNAAFDASVEIGGLDPFFAINAPVYMLDSLVDTHVTFISWLASQRPQAKLVNQKVEDVGRGVYRISVTLINQGASPALTQMGQRVKWVQKPKVVLKLAKDQELLSGRPVQLLNALDAGESVTFSWLLQGKGRVTIEAGAPQMGVETLTIETK